MEEIGKLLKADSLVRQSQDGITMAENSEAQTNQPLWLPLLRQLAQDKRQDLAPGTREYWKAKLKSYRDEEICQAIWLYSGEFFPSVDDIAAFADRARIRKAELKSQQDDEKAKEDRAALEKYMREHNGKTPSQVFCEENRDLIRKLDMNLVAGCAKPDREADVLARHQSRSLARKA